MTTVPDERTKAAWRYGPPLLATVVGLGISIFSLQSLSAWQDRSTQFAFGVSAADHVRALQMGIDRYLFKMDAIRAFFDASDSVDRNEFDLFAKNLLDPDRAILTFAWVPRVTRSERAEHERAAAADGIANYRITDIAADDTSSPAAQADEYFPVFFRTESRVSTGYGINLLDGGVRQTTLERARDTGVVAATENYKLHSGANPGDRNGFIALLPVYFPNNVDTVEARRRNLRGFVEAVFQFRVLIGAILSDLKAPLDFSLFDPSAGNDAPPAFTTSTASWMQPLTMTKVMTQSPSWVGNLRIGDRIWRIGVTPSVAEWTMIRHANAWLVFVAGLLITSAVVAYMIGAIRRVEGLVASKQMLWSLSRTDASTGLRNRRAFLEGLSAAASSGMPFAIYLIDLDGFKDVNDTQGHAVGDQLLKAATARLARSVGSGDLVARLGGDEFAILQHSVSGAAPAESLAAKIGETLAAPYSLNGVDVNVTASIGIALQGQKTDDPGSILIRADLALYDAKAGGRNCFRFHTSLLDQQVNLRVAMDRDLRAGIERDEFELYHQPQVEISSGKIVGLEALVRWNHPVHGLITPSSFIPIAEMAGGIVALGEWILMQACRQVAEWEHDGLIVPPLAVNVSGAQLRRPEDFEKIVRHAFSMWSIRRNAIELELTESVLMDVTQRQTDLLQRMREIGATIAVDDFGTGYSSLRYLAAYPVNRLKIAQELIAHVTSEHRNAVVVRSAIRLAEDLGIECIAEGVETIEQARKLREFGCKYAQGYYYSRPMVAARVAQLLIPSNAPMSALPLR